MKRKSQSLFLPLALLFVFHFLHAPPAFADTDGSEIQVVSPSYLEVPLGPAFAGTEFQFRTDTGIYPGLIQVGEDGVLCLEIGGSSHYILSCVSMCARRAHKGKRPTTRSVFWAVGHL